MFAYVVIAILGCLLYPLVYGGINRSFGVYFLHYQERFDAKAAEVALMSLVENITNSIVGQENNHILHVNERTSLH